MPDGRIRWALLIVAGLLLIVTGAAWVASAHRPAPVVISSVTPAQLSPVRSSPAHVPFARTPSSPAPDVPPDVPQDIPSQPVATTPVLLYVDVAGAVRHPSLYQLPSGSRVWHAIKAAGGATSKADLDAINLAEKIQDGEKIYVPTHTAQGAQTGAPVLEGSEAVGSESANPSIPVAARSAGGTSEKPAKLISAEQGQVDINTAGADGLERLPGIGPAMANRILAYRQQAGRFASTDELMQVSGIGPKKYAHIAPMVKL